MIRATLGGLLLLLSFGLAAQKTETPEATGNPTRTGDQFEMPSSLDMIPGSGIGFDFTGTRDSDGLQTRRTRLGALTHYDSPYDFVAVTAGTDYFKQGDWSARGYSLWGIAEDRHRATGGGISARVGLSQVGGHGRALADATWNVRFSPQTGMELILQRDLIESRRAIENGVTQAFVAASIDHAFTDRFTGIGLAGAQRFSDGNDRTHLRGWLIYTLLPEYGVGVQARARVYENSQRGSAFYFNPEHYENADIGLRWRKGLGGWRIYALLAAGRERIEHSQTNPTRFAQLNVDRVLTGDIRVGLRYAYSRASGDDTAFVSNPDYTWRYLRLVLVVPL